MVAQWLERRSDITWNHQFRASSKVRAQNETPSNGHCKVGRMQKLRRPPSDHLRSHDITLLITTVHILQTTHSDPKPPIVLGIKHGTQILAHILANHSHTCIFGIYMRKHEDESCRVSRLFALHTANMGVKMDPVRTSGFRGVGVRRWSPCDGDGQSPI